MELDDGISFVWVTILYSVFCTGTVNPNVASHLAQHLGVSSDTGLRGSGQRHTDAFAAKKS